MDKPKLKTLPVVRDEESHSYIWLPTMTVMAYSVTTVAKLGKPYTGPKSAGIRGTHVHLCLEHFLTGAAQPNWQGYGDFIEPLLAHDYWNDFEPWIVEGMVCDLKKSVGGQFDLLGYDHKRGKVTLVDLKSQGRRNLYDVRPQLGGYCQMILDHHQLVIDECRVMWARPGEAELGQQVSADECSEIWSDTWDHFQLTRPRFTTQNDASSPASQNSEHPMPTSQDQPSPSGLFASEKLSTTTPVHH